RRRVPCDAGLAAEAPVALRPGADRRDAGGRPAAPAVSLLEPRAALARPAWVLASVGRGDARSDARTLRGRRAIRVRGDRRSRGGRAALSRRERSPHGVRAGVGVLRRERSALARDDRFRLEQRERGIFPGQVRRTWVDA